MSAGDIAITVPKVITVGSLVLMRLEYIIAGKPTDPAVTPELRAHFAGADGNEHVVVVRNAVGTCVGFSLSGGVFTDDIKISGNTNELNTLLGILFQASARTNGVQELINKGIISITGTVG